MTAMVEIAGLRMLIEGGGVAQCLQLEGMLHFVAEGDKYDFRVETTAVLPSVDCRWLHRFEYGGNGSQCRFGRDAEGNYVYDFGYGRKLVCDASLQNFSLSPIDGDIVTLRFALWLAYGMAGLRKRVIPVHSSAVVSDGRAVLCLGESGAGKSTHTALWQTTFDGSFLLNDDSPVVVLSSAGVMAYGSPWSGKKPCFRRDGYPVAAFVRIVKHAENAICRLPLLQAWASLQPSCPPCMAYDDDLSDRLFPFVARVVEKVPIYRLMCRADQEAVMMVQNALKGQNYNL